MTESSSKVQTTPHTTGGKLLKRRKRRRGVTKKSLKHSVQSQESDRLLEVASNSSPSPMNSGPGPHSRASSGEQAAFHAEMLIVALSSGRAEGSEGMLTP